MNVYESCVAQLREAWCEKDARSALCLWHACFHFAARSTSGCRDHQPISPKYFQQLDQVLFSGPFPSHLSTLPLKTTLEE